MRTFCIKDTFTDGKVVVTDCLSFDEAAHLVQLAQHNIDSGLLRECVMTDREGKEIVRVS